MLAIKFHDKILLHYVADNIKSLPGRLENGQASHAIRNSDEVIVDRRVERRPAGEINGERREPNWGRYGTRVEAKIKGADSDARVENQAVECREKDSVGRVRNVAQCCAGIHNGAAGTVVSNAPGSRGNGEPDTVYIHAFDGDVIVGVGHAEVSEQRSVAQVPQIPVAEDEVIVFGGRAEMVHEAIREFVIGIR